ncbi:MAG TPA: class I adenylate-forming enzyme family protein [Methylomirabilota bacterium]|nr:class I adenylate-forming enzyme family protein [Methylomirabilota bacterium]
MNLADLLFTTAERHSPRRAITDVRSGRSVSYGQLAREAERVAAFLKAEGVEPGQRIGLLAPNDLTYLPAAFGLLAAGACFVPLASNLTPSEIAEIVREVQLNGCFAWPKAAPLPSAPGHADESARRAVVKGGECDGYAFQWIDRGAEAPAEFGKLNAAFIRFTSGTTARSKGVVLSHEATLARVEASDRVLKFSEEDRILWVLPLAYHFAVTITAYVRAGSHILLCADTLPKAIVDGARRLKASVLYAAPLHFERMANLGPGGPLSSIRVTLSTAAPISSVVMERFESVYGVPVGQAYGIIEAGLPCINLGNEGLPAASVGRPVPGYDIAVLSDEGAVLPAETLGEIAVRGSGLFSAYYSPWRLREQIAVDDWFLTGDLGFLDRKGALHLKGRKKALILVAGLKFFPEEVEDCINQFPGIKESRVFSRPHARMGEVPCAEVAVEPGCDLDGLKSHCARALSSYKIPVEFTVVDAVPRTPSGKIRR